MAPYFFLRLLSGRLFAIADFFESLAELAPGDVAIEFAGALLLAFHLDARGEVLEVNTRSGFVDFLATTAAALDEFFKQGVIGNTE